MSTSAIFLPETELSLADHTPITEAEIDRYVDDIIARVQGYMLSVDAVVIRREIQKAYQYAKEAHSGQFRRSGDPYIIHPVLATVQLLSIKPDLTTIQALFLHDVPEDTDRTIEEVQEHFGEDVAFIVAGVEKLSKIKYRGEERNIGSLRKMFIAMSEDLRVIFVKLADRIHNMQTLGFHPMPEKRERIAIETLNIYAPIADRLGIFDFKEILENEAFKILHPSDYERVTSELAALRPEQDAFLSHARSLIAETFAHEGIPIIDVSSRIKSPWSIYRKMQRKNYEHVADLYDIFALRIITESVADCYNVLGHLHNRWTPVPRRFKDYIALPKENGYQSLHTTVVGFFRELAGPVNRMQPTEIQIRTKKMHERAEIGMAAHFDYSEKGKSSFSGDVYWVSELKDILSTSQDSEFLSDMKITVFEDRIFVFTPKGDIKILPRGGTPVDFAYAIHSDLGNHITIARVNGRVAPLDCELKNGDSVEIVIDRNRKPSITWLSFVKTVRAKDVIKSAINRDKRDELLEKGRFILGAYLRRHYGKELDKDCTLLNHLDDRVLDVKAKEEVLVQLGNLSRKPSSVMRSVAAHHQDLRRVDGKKEPVYRGTVTHGTPGRIGDTHTEYQPQEEAAPPLGSVIIGGQTGVEYRVAQCCRPKE